MRRFLDRLYNFALVLAGLFLVGIFAVMVTESVLRKFGGYVTGASELIGWFLAAAGFLALPATFRRGDMVRVSVLLDALQPSLRKAILLLCAFVALVFTGYMLYAAGLYVLDGIRSGETNQGMIEVAVWVPQSSFVVGVALLLVAVVDTFVELWPAEAAGLAAERAPTLEDAASH